MMMMKKKKEEEYENQRRKEREKLEDIKKTEQAAYLLANSLSKALHQLEQTTQKVQVLEEKKVPALEGQVQGLEDAMEEMKQEENNNGDSSSISTTTSSSSTNVT